jgi:hypothetical protein
LLSVLSARAMLVDDEHGRFPQRALFLPDAGRDVAPQPFGKDCPQEGLRRLRDPKGYISRAVESPNTDRSGWSGPPALISQNDWPPTGMGRMGRSLEKPEAARH